MKVKKISFTAVFTALAIVLNEYLVISIPPTASPFMRLSLGIVALYLVTYYCGFLYGCIAGVLADLLGFLLIGAANGYAFHPGYTLNALIGGIVFGLVYMIKDKVEGKKGLKIVLPVEIGLSIISLSIFNIFYFVSDLTSKIRTISGLIVFDSIIIILDLLVVLYTILRYKNENSNTLVLSFTIYQFIVSLALTPLWVYTLTHTSYLGLWVTRFYTVPLFILIYSIVTELIIFPMSRIIKFKR